MKFMLKYKKKQKYTTQKKLQLTFGERGMRHKWSFCPCIPRRSDFHQEKCDKSRCRNNVHTVSSTAHPIAALRYAVDIIRSK